jgi:hypothetical protein
MTGDSISDSIVTGHFLFGDRPQNSAVNVCSRFPTASRSDNSRHGIIHNVPMIFSWVIDI